MLRKGCHIKILRLHKRKKHQISIKGYRRQLQTISWLHKILSSHAVLCSIPSAAASGYLLQKSVTFPSYKKEYICIAGAVILFLLTIFIWKFSQKVLYKLFFRVQKNAMKQYPHMYQTGKAPDQNSDYDRKIREAYKAAYQKAYSEADRYYRQKQQKESSNTQDAGFFAGVNTPEEAKKRYKELIKIYHPDNSSGDAASSAIVNEQYRAILKQLNNQ
jgi:hypothetical protein